MHALQPKHIKLKPEEVKKLLDRYNISLAQLPKIRIGDPAIPQDSHIGDVFRIERKEDDKVTLYFRVVVP